METLSDSGSAPLPPSSDLSLLEERDDPVDTDLYDSSPDCIKILRLDGTIKRVNPGGQAALELDTLTQLDGSDWPSLWPGSERGRVEDAVAAGREGQRTQFLAFCPTAKNTPRWWDVVVTPMPGKSAALRGLLVVSRDVTELVHAKEALARINEQKDAFLVTLSHELRNPLSALDMAASLIERSHGDATQTAKIADLIRRQVGHMSRLTEDLLDISRIDRGQVSLKNAVFDLRDIVEDAEEQLASLLSGKGQVLRKTLPDDPVSIAGDRMRLAQVLGNLIGNASRYSPAHASITISIPVNPQTAMLTVADKGKGIAEEQLATLFDMYSQGQSNPDRKASGVGVGLAIVKGLVELHGGTVRGSSGGPGLGSTFTVALPLSCAL